MLMCNVYIPNMLNCQIEISIFAEKNNNNGHKKCYVWNYLYYILL